MTERYEELRGRSGGASAAGPSFINELQEAGRAIETLAVAKSEQALSLVKKTGLRLAIVLGLIFGAVGLLLIGAATLVVALARLFPSPIALLMLALGMIACAVLLTWAGIASGKMKVEPEEAKESGAEAAAATEDIKTHFEHMTERASEAMSPRNWLEGIFSRLGKGTSLGIIGLGAVMGALFARLHRRQVEKPPIEDSPAGRPGRRRIMHKFADDFETRLVRGVGALSWQVILPSLVASFLRSRGPGRGTA